MSDSHAKRVASVRRGTDGAQQVSAARAATYSSNAKRAFVAVHAIRA